MATRTINLTEMSCLKKRVAEQFSTELHYHGSCGGQNFSVDSSSAELRSFLEEYFGEKGLSLSFSIDGLRFYAINQRCKQNA